MCIPLAGRQPEVNRWGLQARGYSVDGMGESRRLAGGGPKAKEEVEGNCTISRK